MRLSAKLRSLLSDRSSFCRTTRRKKEFLFLEIIVSKHWLCFCFWPNRFLLVGFGLDQWFMTVNGFTVSYRTISMRIEKSCWSCFVQSNILSTSIEFLLERKTVCSENKRNLSDISHICIEEEKVFAVYWYLIGLYWELTRKKSSEFVFPYELISNRNNNFCQRCFGRFQLMTTELLFFSDFYSFRGRAASWDLVDPDPIPSNSQGKVKVSDWKTKRILFIFSALEIFDHRQMICFLVEWGKFLSIDKICSKQTDKSH